VYFECTYIHIISSIFLCLFHGVFPALQHKIVHATSKTCYITQATFSSLWQWHYARNILVQSIVGLHTEMYTNTGTLTYSVYCTELLWGITRNLSDTLTSSCTDTLKILFQCTATQEIAQYTASSHISYRGTGFCLLLSWKNKPYSSSHFLQLANALKASLVTCSANSGWST
jgi:hypothetical protein